MEATQKHIVKDGSAILYNQSMQGPNSYYQHPSQHVNISVQTFEPYSTLESSSSATQARSCQNNSSSTTSFSANKSPELHRSPDDRSGSPISGSSVTNNDADISFMLKELETAMLGPDLDSFGTGDNDSGLSGGQNTTPSAMYRCMEMISRGDLKGLLCECAKAVENYDQTMVDWLITQLQQMVSVSGEPVQRLGAYMLEGLIARLASSGSSIYKALQCKEPTGPELLSYMHILYEACPYFKFGYESANGAIAEAVKNERFVHIIDFQISQGAQWISLIRALGARPGGPPKIRITGIDDSRSAFARQGGLEIVGQRLSRLAELCRVPFEFNGAALSGPEVQIEHLGVRQGEAIAVNFPLVLHHMPDESVSVENHRDRLLRLVKRLSPRVVTLVEQEANTNTAPFFPRFVETMNHYLAVFESIDVKLPRDHKERINVEQHCLAREIVNLVACEGIEREERHELLGKWRSRFHMAGFKPYPLSSFVNATIKALMESYSDKYTLEERDEALYLGWKNLPLITSCAWR
ncbi:PREDICTED: scarecrow-like protein 5 [Tarenaya hassleriana]|uniref:scarecrow-like protein 5 n=1 Tax=Tarenaya hassleriana TaxID=28532 RepID=UPI00053C9CF6|nr:PREDICTED: scarecrow-like protein 5 [Tarenaya hassleriana]XP_010545482.1 PREDICTED: scarecrow-like protein 5 [Tarenaya hassleriana]XP_010545483.1 PREDICTED: scarecrow-like protein 5 [Tarenaya hassleriana]